jgi:hypothetical protein
VAGKVFADAGLATVTVLCAGGVRFEPSFGEAAFRAWDGAPGLADPVSAA